MTDTQLTGPPGAIYRLVIRRGDRGLVRDPGLFKRPKHAISHVATIVRRHAHEGAPDAVLLQRGILRDEQGHPTPTSASDAFLLPSTELVQWTTLEHWDSQVIDRILQQESLKRRPWSAVPLERTRLPKASAAPCVEEQPPASGPHRTPGNCPALSAATRGHHAAHSSRAAAVAPSGIPEAASGPHRSIRRHFAVAAIVLIATWIALIVLFSGGRLQALLNVWDRPASAEITSELPFDGPLSSEDQRQP